MATLAPQTLLDSIAATIADYREGEIPQPSAAHVAKWAKQFDPTQQVPILTEIDVLLKKTYINKARMERFLLNLVTNQKLAGC